MKVIDQGHEYELSRLDGEGVERLRFVKRDTPPTMYPGNAGHYSGTTVQEVLRCLIDRLRYVNGQIPCAESGLAITDLQTALWRLELRAARRHGRLLRASPPQIELLGVCQQCGHIECTAHDRSRP